MKIIVLSDTHGNQSLALSILDGNGDANRIVHLGDEVEDARFIEEISGKSVIKLAGNCDFSTDQPRENTLDVAGRRIFLTHGDLYNVKAGLEKLLKRAAAVRADVVLYGHTHQAAVLEIGGILLVNPGCLKKGCDQPSFAVVTIGVDSVSAEIIPVTPPLP